DVFRTCSGMILMHGMVQYGGIVFLPIYMQVVRGRSATNSGLQLVPVICGVTIAAMICGRLVTRTGRYKIYPILGFTLTTVALVLYSTMNQTTSLLATTSFMVLFGAGLGLTSPVVTTALQNAVDIGDLGIATALNMFFRSLGGALGVAVFGSI